MLRIIAVAMVLFGSLVTPTEASGIDYSGVPQDGRGDAMTVAGLGWVGYLTPQRVVAVEPVQMQVDATPVAREITIQPSPAFLPAGSAAASLTRVPEPGSALLLGLAVGAFVLRRRR